MLNGEHYTQRLQKLQKLQKSEFVPMIEEKSSWSSQQIDADKLVSVISVLVQLVNYHIILQDICKI